MRHPTLGFRLSGSGTAQAVLRFLIWNQDFNAHAALQMKLVVNEQSVTRGCRDRELVASIVLSGLPYDAPGPPVLYVGCRSAWHDT